MNLWFCTIKLYLIVFVQFFISIFNVWECSFPQRIINTVYYYQIWIFVNLVGKKWYFSVVLIWIYLIISGVLFHLYRDHFSLYMNHVFIPFVCSFFFFYCSGFCHTLKWNSHGFTCVPHPDPPSHLPLHPLPLGLPSAPGPSACLMHPTWAGDLFHPR